jgi:hypothetical protein
MNHLKMKCLRIANRLDFRKVLGKFIPTKTRHCGATHKVRIAVQKEQMN